MTDDGIAPIGDGARQPARTDAELDLEGKAVALDKERADLQRMRDELETERGNRKLRGKVAIAALSVMLVQIATANGIFVWYGDTNGWDISATAVSAWLGSTVVQIVGVVLVITNYLFPRPSKGAE